ncbi:multidrug effflux MFS transporter [Corynebacterium breve]|uniref:Multidrug effflux MFS transporter n=1 Tax=Corynebacterium breve TaxID=3049799 RepID=A0ABY8VF10_9CORY|nr:multidrug effflux MFS transporter [Corynebacterium breve]WIM66843.1 multidrug effflux MFS transporter [Corynebacterium breve]
MDKESNSTIAPVLLVVLAAVSTIAPLTINMYLSGLPQLSRELGVGQTAGQLTLTAFLVGMAVGQIVIGPISDSVGRRKLFVGGAFVLIFATVLAAVAPSIAVMYTARVLQGLAGGTAMVLARAVAGDLVQGKELARIFSLLMVLGGVAPVIGPVIGGIVVDQVGWRGVFWVLAIFNVLVWIGVVRVVPESHPEENRQPLSFATLGRAFTVLFRDRVFLGHSLGFIFSFVTMFAYVSASPYVLQEHYGFTPLQYSMIFATNTTGLFIVALLNARLLKKHTPLFLARIYNVVQFTATIYLVIVALLGLNKWFILVGLFFVVATNGGNMANNSAIAISRAGSLTGTASAIMGSGQFLFGGIVSPIVGVVAAWGISQPVAMTVVMLIACTIATFGIQVIGAKQRA